MHDIASRVWSELTSRQRSIWLEVTASGNEHLFQVGAVGKMPQELNLKILGDAMTDVVSRHDALRLVIDPQQPRQRFEALSAVKVQVVDLSHEMKPDDAILEYVDELCASPFPLGHRPLFQLIVARAGEGHNWIILRVHHIITDAVALSLTFKDIFQTYEALKTGAQSERPESSYLTFMTKDALYRNSLRHKRDLEYWRDRLRDLPEPLVAKLRSEDASSRSMLVRQLTFDRFNRFKAQCTALNLRPTNVVLALSAWLVGSATGKSEVVLGVAYPGRAKEEQDTIGIFSGVMPFRVTLPSASSLADLATSITRSINRDYLHHRLPIDDIRRSLASERRKRGPLVDAMISYVPLDVIDFDFEFGGGKIEGHPLRGAEANPLAIYMCEIHKDSSIPIEFAFDRGFFEDREIALLADRFELLLDRFIEHPQDLMVPVAPLIDAGESISLKAETSYASEQKEPDYNVQIASTFTAEPIATPLQFWLQRAGIAAKLQFAGYNQVFQELFAPKGQMRLNRRGANVILVRPEDWLRLRSAEESFGEQAEFLEKVSDEFLVALKGAASKSHVPYVVLIAAPSPQWDAGGPCAEVQDRVSQKLLEELRQVANLQILSYRDLREMLPIINEYDSVGDELGHIPYSTSAFIAMATFVARHIHLATRPLIKVIVTDCDNTLWDGVVAEDGATGVLISESHRKLQERLVAAAKSGVLICLSSKNIEEDVTAVFEREDMVLKREHIVGFKINWKAKSENIRDLANELNLGLDSFLFLDDNPIEIAEVVAACPQVISVLMKMSGPGAIQPKQLWLLDSMSATVEDSKRVESYRSTFSRKLEREQAADFASFLKGLNLEIAVEAPSEQNIDRLAQLTERTNQFNINCVTRSGAELSEQAAQASHAVLAFRVSDKFGEYGIVSLFSARLDGKSVVVDTFLMSCRVLGRGVEHRMIAEIGRLAVEYGASNVRIPVLVSDRNLPVRRFLDSIGEPCEINGERRLYVLPSERAAACKFEAGHDVEDPQDTLELATSRGERKVVSGEIWADCATRLTTVAEIEKAIRSSAVDREPQSRKVSRAPGTETERVLEELLSHALELQTIGADEDFFDLGVHSLMAVQLVSRIRKQFGFQMSIRSLFECSTIAQLAKAIDQRRSSGYQPLVPLQHGDKRPALFCCHPANGDAVCYMRLSKAIGPDQTIYGFEASGLSPGEAMARSFSEMASCYIEEMIAVQPSGPYHLLGWSLGGALAFEIARQLAEAGKDVGFVGFMDAVAPGKGVPPAPYRIADEPTAEDEAKLLDHIEVELNTIRRYQRLPPLVKQGDRMAWQDAIDGFHRIGVVPEGYSIEEMRRKMLVYFNCGQLFQQYRPHPLPIPLIHFRATQNFREWNFDWSDFTTKSVQTIWIRCNHYRMGFEPNTTTISAHLRALLRGEKVTIRWWQKIPLTNWISDFVELFVFKRA